MRTLLRFLIAWLLLIGGATPVLAQRVLTSTTLSSALSDSAATSMVVTSNSGFAVGDAPVGPKLALIDREIVAVSAVNATIIRIARGQNGSRAATHLSGATVWVGPPAAFYSFVPSGQCQRTLTPSVPYIVGGVLGGGSEAGTIWDCLGLTTAGQWVQTNGTSAQISLVIGSTVSSATSVTATAQYFKMSGTVNPVSTIALPAGAGVGFQLYIEPTGAWVTDTAGNILIASTAVVGKLMTMTWNGTKWVPSY